MPKVAIGKVPGPRDSERWWSLGLRKGLLLGMGMVGIVHASLAGGCA